MPPKRLSLRNPRLLEAWPAVEGCCDLTSAEVCPHECVREEVERRCANTEQHHPKAMAGCGFSARVRRQISENERPAADADEQPKPEGRESIERGKCRVSEKVRHVACSTWSPDQLAGSMPATWHRKGPNTAPILAELPEFVAKVVWHEPGISQ
jgi:hypothetical protein